GAHVIAVGRSDEKLVKARTEGAEWTVKAGPDAPAQIMEITKGGAEVTVDALGSSETMLPALKSLRKYGRHLQLGLTGAKDAGNVHIPMDLVVFNEARIIGSFGCPLASYVGLLSTVADGILRPSRLVETQVSVSEAGRLLNDMTTYNTLG